MYVKLNNGYLYPISFAVRIDSDLINGLRYVGFINFNKSNEQKTLGLITDLEGKITGMTQDANNLFEIGSNICSTNNDIDSAYKSLNEIKKFKLDCKVFGKHFNKVIKDTNIMHHWTIKSKWSRSNIVDLQIGNSLVKARVKIKDYIVHQLRECIRMVEINFYNLHSVILDHVD